MTFIALDGTYENKVTSQGYIPPEQLNFVDETIAKSKNDEVVKFHRTLTDVDNQIAKTLERLDLILKDDPDKPGKFRTTSILEEITKQMGGGINE